MSLRARLMVLVLLATLVPALLVAWRFLRDSEIAIEAAAAALAAAAEGVAADLGQRVQGTAQLQYGLVRSRDLDGADRKTCSAFLSAVREAYPQYTGILTVLPDGQLFCDSLRTQRTLNLTDRAYFQRALKPDSGLTLEPVFGRLTGIPVLQIVYPVRDEGAALRYMVVASLNLLGFAQGSPATALRPTPELLLLDHKGTVLVWSGADAPAKAAGTSIADTPLFRLATAHPNGGIGEAADRQGRTQVWAVAGAAAAQQAGLYVMLGVGRQDLVAAAQRRLRQDLLVLAAVAALLFSGVWLLAEWGVRRQVGRITTLVRRLGEGDLAARIEQPYPRGELGGLMAVLNSTAASLQRQRAAIEELGLQLRQAHKLEAIGTLAGGIAHDFNNVLGAILGNLALAQDELRAGQSPQPSLAQIRRAALRARDLVQRIQSFSRRDAPALTALALQPVVEEVLELVQVALPAGVTLTAELHGTGLRVMGDATQLHQVLLNLCTNAWQAVQGVPGTVTVGLETAVLEADPARRPTGMAAGPCAHLWVADTGCGIAAADRERIFEPFFTTKGASGGTGLGLSLVQGIVSGHGGSLTLSSVPGQGSTFHVHLPLLANPAEGAQAMPSPANGPTRGQGQRVLYVDDDEVMRVMVERLLVRAGYVVRSHGNPHAALDELRADPQSCDVVVTDYNMPELSGLEVGRALAALRPGLPVIIISGYVADDLPAKAQRAGVREIVRKEQVLEDLAPAIARALGGA